MHPTPSDNYVEYAIGLDHLTKTVANTYKQHLQAQQPVETTLRIGYLNFRHLNMMLYNLSNHWRLTHLTYAFSDKEDEVMQDLELNDKEFVYGSFAIKISHMMATGVEKIRISVFEDEVILSVHGFLNELCMGAVYICPKEHFKTEHIDKPLLPQDMEGLFQFKDHTLYFEPKKLFNYYLRYSHVMADVSLPIFFPYEEVESDSFLANNVRVANQVAMVAEFMEYTPVEKTFLYSAVMSTVPYIMHGAAAFDGIVVGIVVAFYPRVNDVTPTIAWTSRKKETLIEAAKSDILYRYTLNY